MKPLLFLLILTVSLAAQAQRVTTNRKTDEKKSARWSIDDWLAQKQKGREQNFWLARNSHSSPFEFYADGGAINYNRWAAATPDAKTNHNMSFGGLSLFADIAGLQGRFESYPDSQSIWQGGFNLRVLGRAIQDTHLNLEYGFRGYERDTTQGRETFQNQFGGVNGALYFTKHFGIEGAYRILVPHESELHRELRGESSEAGLFIDFDFVRLYGRWKRDLFIYEYQSAASSEFREGFGGGLKVFF